MKPSLLSWVCSVLTLHSVSLADEPPSFAELPNEMQLAMVQRFVVSQKIEVCDYVDWLAVSRWAYPHTDVGMAMLAKIAEEEASLGLNTYRGRVRKQRILNNVRTFVRIRTGLLIDCTRMEGEELRDLAGAFESSYGEYASLSESPTWKKACMAGLFGHNSLITLLPHLSPDFCSDNKDLLLQTAFFIGDIGSLQAMVDTLGLSKEEVLAKVPEVDIVFSGSVPFLEELVEFLPNMMEQRLSLIREACSLDCLDILTFLLEVAQPGELDELDPILDSFWKLKMFKHQGTSKYYPGYKQPYRALEVAAQHGYVPIIRFLWPMMMTKPNRAKMVIKKIMTEADRDNHRSVLEFFLWQSGEDYMKMAHKYVNAAFKAAVERGNVDIIALLTGKNNDGTFVSPGLCLPTLDEWDFEHIIKTNKNWDGIKYLVDLKKKGDPRFADFGLVDQDNIALCMACEVGNYDLVECLLCTTDDGEFVVPRTNPAAQNNRPLEHACAGGHGRIVEKLLERDTSGNYIYKCIEPSCGIYCACRNGHFPVVKFLLKMRDGRYVLPRMDGVNFTKVLSAAIESTSMKVLEFLLTVKNGNYVLPGMNSVDFTSVLLTTIQRRQMEMVRFFLQMKDEEYVLPGMNGVDFTKVLSSEIMWGEMDSLKWLLSMNDIGEYVLPGMTGVDFTSVLLDAICWNRMEMLRFLLEMKYGRYGLPGINGVDFIRVLSSAIKWGEMDSLKWLLSMNDTGEYVLPGMTGVDFTSVLLDAIYWNRMEMVRFLLEMKNGSYFLPRMNGVDFTRVLSNAIMWDRMKVLDFLLTVKNGNYVLPGMNSVDFTSVLLTTIQWRQMEMVRFFLQMKDEEYVLPGMTGVDFTQVLSTAIEKKQRGLVKWLLRRNKGGKYVLPGMNGVDFTRILSTEIKSPQMGTSKWLLRMKGKEYVLPGMKSVDFTSVLSAAIHWYRGFVVKWLLRMNKGGEYVLPGMNDVDLTNVLLDLIKSGEVSNLKWLLGMNKGEEYVFPAMNGVDLGRALIVAIACNQMEVLEFLLAVESGKYVLPGIRVTEGMLGIEGQSHEMRKFLARNLEWQRINA